jgi:hypothetical protein
MTNVLGWAVQSYVSACLLLLLCWCSPCCTRLLLLLSTRSACSYFRHMLCTHVLEVQVVWTVLIILRARNSNS